VLRSDILLNPVDDTTAKSRILLQAATSSAERFEILDLAVRTASFGVSQAATAIGRNWGTAQGHVTGLIDGGLVESTTPRAYTATADGRRAHECVVTGPSQMMFRALIGQRLVSVRFEDQTEPKRVLHAMRRSAIAVLHTDDAYDLVGLYPDDPALVKTLRSKLHQLGVRSVALSRVADVTGGKGG
jgi:hypothetical protein